MGYEKQSILDNYELGGIVGEGSYGTVHKAKNKETGRYVAIKKFIEDDQTTLKIAHREVNPTRIKRTRTMSVGHHGISDSILLYFLQSFF